ncbi:hypothetical protein NDU88_003956 [Pleurodeles waltl]|uniref:Uncharacterized protein n=1 Tax=Pleurodeles waltl TaxID=8319 RepID=A0AAV7V323_PLEWA|nr:hypothetical protein NDU88_003956 [Pleurodeles waltl]
MARELREKSVPPFTDLTNEGECPYEVKVYRAGMLLTFLVGRLFLQSVEHHEQDQKHRGAAVRISFLWILESVPHLTYEFSDFLCHWYLKRNQTRRTSSLARPGQASGTLIPGLEVPKREAPGRVAPVLARAGADHPTIRFFTLVLSQCW